MHITEDFNKTVGNDRNFCTGDCADLQLFTAPGPLGMLSAFNYFFTYIFWSHFEIMLNVARSKKVKIISTLIKIYIWGSNHTLKSADIYLRNCDYDFRLLCALLPFSQNSFQILFFV